MTITELIAALEDIRARDGDLEVLCLDQGSTDPSGVVRVEAVTVTNAQIYELGNGMAGWTLDESPRLEGACVLVVLLD